jgi:hypothetical protein
MKKWTQKKSHNEELHNSHSWPMNDQVKENGRAKTSSARGKEKCTRSFGRET